MPARWTDRVIGTVEDLFENYQYFLEEALEHFCKKHWPCEYVSRKGERCVKPAATHGVNNHQNADGQVIGRGDYQTNFSYRDTLPRWLKLVETRAREDRNELGRRGNTQKEISNARHALRIHRERMNIFFTAVGGAQQYVSHLTCFCCLKNVPEHPLQCGHTLCSECVRGYSRPGDGCFRTLKSCPLHHTTSQFAEPWRIAVKPEFAGARILCLDG